MFKSILLMVVGAGLFAVSVRADEARPASNPDRVVAAVPTVAHPAPTPTPAGIDVGWMFPLPAQASIDAPDAETHSVAVAANLYVVWYKMPGKRLDRHQRAVVLPRLPALRPVSEEGLVVLRRATATASVTSFPSGR